MQARTDVVTALQCWGGGSEWRPDLVTSVLLGPDADSFNPPAAAAAQVCSLLSHKALYAKSVRDQSGNPIHS